jgi:lysophospholipase L1-like esterase
VTARLALAWLLLTGVVAIDVIATRTQSGGVRWIGAWSTAPQPAMPTSLQTFLRQTLRLVVHTSIGGSRLRIHLSNTYGDRRLVIGAAHIARRTSGPGIEPESDRILTFGGKAAVSVPRGATTISDGVPLQVSALSDLAISLYLPDETPASTSHLLALQESYVSADTGDSTGLATFVAGRTTRSWPFLTGVDVDGPADGATIVAFGDSTVDGDGSTTNANHRFTDVLAERLQRDAKGKRFSVLNEGIVGNRLLRETPHQPPNDFGDFMGESGLERFDRDALEQAGVRAIIVRIGVNDLAFPGAFSPAAESVTPADLIAGYRELAARARRRGIRIIGTTITPFENATISPAFYTPQKEIARQQVNAWIRGSRDFNAVIDLDQIVRDPVHASRLLPAFDSGDHVHTNDAGYAAAADAIPLSALGIQ